MRKLLLLIPVLLVTAGLARSALFTVDRTEFVYLTQFGRPIAIFDGAEGSEAGLHVKWPWPVQSVQRLDRRLQYFDLPATEVLTSDARGPTIDKTLTVDAYVCWRIADRDGVDRFIRTIGTPERARTVLSGRVTSDLGAAIGELALDDLVSVDSAKVDAHREALRRRLLDGSGGEGLKQRAREEYGIELIDLRLRRTSHPSAVQDAIFQRIRSERGKKAAEHESEGAREAEQVRSNAERQVRELLARAKADELRIRGEADADADRIRNTAYLRDVEFYTFLKKLEEYQRILGDNRTILLLSTHRELFDLLFQPPKPGGETKELPKKKE
jgi:modulator of FtsH protease HflC